MNSNISSTILIVNGPNLDRLGKRQPEVYGTETLDDIIQGVQDHARSLDTSKKLGRELSYPINIESFQSNSEGELITRIHQAADEHTPVVINAGGLTHTSIALRDALAELEPGFVEVHISNVYARESFRHHSFLSDIALGVIAGLGSYGYTAAVDFILKNIVDLQSQTFHA